MIRIAITLKRIKDYILNDVVLSVAIILALISSCFVLPDGKYLSYIDFNTLILLFCLMTVMSGLRSLGVFDKIAVNLISLTKSVKGLIFILVILPFIFSMIITNDVALITFVPLTLVVLSISSLENLAIIIIVLQTIAANLGSMLTPMGNPQNLYLYSKSGIKVGDFINITLPYTVISFTLLILCIILVRTKNATATLDLSKIERRKNTASTNTHIFVFLILFVICIGCVFKTVPHEMALILVLVCTLMINKKLLLTVDYALLFTFIGFFIFIGNMSRIDWFSNLINSVLNGHETLVSVLSSQIISNVPAALLLSGFSDNYSALIVGVNLGGLGTLIASMASLISYKQITKAHPEMKKKYFITFTLLNVIFLIGLLLLSYFIN